MTVQEKSNNTWCLDCKYFTPIFLNVIGLCQNEKATHFKHIIEEMHPACFRWESKV